MTTLLTVLTTGIISLFSQRVSSSLVTFDYSFKVDAQVPVTGKGNVEFEGESFHMKGNGLEIWSDSETRWTFDSSARELYIESVDPSCTDYISNPALLINSIGSAFVQEGEESTTFAGRKVTAISLLPVSEDTGLKSVILYFTSENIPSGAVITVSDGTVSTFNFTSFAFRPRNERNFRCLESSLGEDVLTTDLR